MNPLLKRLLMALVLAVLAVLAGTMGVGPLQMPGYLLVRLFVTLPDPYRAIDPSAPHAIAISAASFAFWLALFAAWAFIKTSREQRGTRSQHAEGQ